MRTSLVAGIVTLTAFAPTTAARAEPPLAARRCGFVSFGDPATDGMHTAVVDGGPVVIGDRTGHLTCTIQVDAPTHAGADACSVTGSEEHAVLTAAGTCAYFLGVEGNVYFCMQVTVTAPVAETWYWDEWNDKLRRGAWSRDPGSDCGAPRSLDSIGPDWTLDDVLCPWFSTALPPEGDVVLPDPVGLFWDCPPYEA